MALKGRTIIVTGGASGIGRVIALLLAREGARSFIGDIDEEGGRSTASEGAAAGLAIEFLPLDLTSSSSVDDFVAAVHGEVERIDGLVNDAGRVGSTGETVYAAAKGGPIAFTKSLARQMERYGININCVCPGPTDTPLFRRQPERIKQALIRAIPFRRIAQPVEIAQAIVFFLSDHANYITGQVLSVSGGLTMAG